MRLREAQSERCDKRLIQCDSDAEYTFLNEKSFRRMISIERKRTERSRKPFLLMLLDTGTIYSAAQNGEALSQILSSLLTSIRETDVTGWYKDDCIIGIMFTELVIDGKSSLLATMLTRMSNALKDRLTFEDFNKIRISFHLFPDDWTHGLPYPLNNTALYPDLVKRDDARKLFSAIKRIMDTVGSLLALAIALPLFLAIAAVIKISSKGPVLYTQKRVGQHGRPFLLLKFRSMYSNSDSRVHQEYTKQLIAGQAMSQSSNGNGKPVFKLTQDTRITPIGAFLRRTSLDELPQFLNVLMGEMSLVGPRPPLFYELEAYDIWHKRRLLEAKPGLTGLWQVSGRNRLNFNDMVRLDLVYAKSWTPWLDVKILLRTPLAVLEGAH